MTVCTGVAALVPHGLVATTLRLYEPGAAALLSARPVVGKPPTKAPVTCAILAGGPPSKVFRQVRSSVEPLARPRSPAGGDGGTGTFTCRRISLEAALLPVPTSECMRT